MAHIKVPTHWSPEQAWIVHELLEDIQYQIRCVYREEIMKEIQSQEGCQHELFDNNDFTIDDDISF